VPSSFIRVDPTQSCHRSTRTNLQLQVAGYIGPNWTAARPKVRLFQQQVHNLHNHEKLVVVVVVYPSQHFATGFWSSFPTHYSCVFQQFCIELLCMTEGSILQDVVRLEFSLPSNVEVGVIRRLLFLLCWMPFWRL
jgi:hypothetical protein